MPSFKILAVTVALCLLSTSELAVWGCAPATRLTPFQQSLLLRLSLPARRQEDDAVNSEPVVFVACLRTPLTAAAGLAESASSRYVLRPHPTSPTSLLLVSLYRIVKRSPCFPMDPMHSESRRSAPRAGRANVSLLTIPSPPCCSTSFVSNLLGGDSPSSLFLADFPTVSPPAIEKAQDL